MLLRTLGPLLLMGALQTLAAPLESVEYAYVRENPVFGVKRELGQQPQTLPIHLELGDRSLWLLLERSELQPDNVDIEFTDEKGLHEHTKSDVGLYQDVTRGAAIAVDFSKKDLELRGTVKHEGQFYEVSPVEKKDALSELVSRVLGSDEKPLHQLKRYTLSPKTRGDYVVPDDAPEQESFPDVNFANKRQDYKVNFTTEAKRGGADKVAQEEYPEMDMTNKRDGGPQGGASRNQRDFYVQLMFVVDYTVWEHFKKRFTTTTRAKNELKYEFSHLFNAMDLSYRTIDKHSDGITITVYLYKIKVLTSRYESGLTLDNTLSYDTLDTDKLLPSKGSIAQWKKKEGLDFGNPDHIHVFSMKKIDRDGVLGVAPLGGICGGRSFSINRYTGFYAWETVAHELGHNLGARHDGNGNHCSENVMNMMTPTDKQPTASTVKARYLFSKCSVEDMKLLLTGSDRYPQNVGFYPRVCTYDVHCKHEEELVGMNQLPGEKYGLDQQCELITGIQGSTLCKNYSPNPCVSIMCSNGRGGCRPSNRAAKGTPCNDYDKSKLCIEGECVRSYSGTPSTGTCTRHKNNVPSGCTDNSPIQWSNGATSCIDQLWYQPSSYFTQRDYVERFCKGTMKKYGMYWADNDPCPSGTSGGSSGGTSGGSSGGTSGGSSSGSGTSCGQDNSNIRIGTSRQTCSQFCSSSIQSGTLQQHKNANPWICDECPQSCLCCSTGSGSSGSGSSGGTSGGSSSGSDNDESDEDETDGDGGWFWGKRASMEKMLEELKKQARKQEVNQQKRRLKDVLARHGNQYHHLNTAEGEK